jgi:hypothetical protein
MQKDKHNATGFATDIRTYMGYMIFLSVFGLLVAIEYIFWSMLK